MVDYKMYVGQGFCDFDKAILVSDKYKAALSQVIGNRGNLTKNKFLIVSAEQCNIDRQNMLCEIVSKEVFEQLELLYHTYEFADNFIYLEYDSTFPMLFNYVQTGILTLEEAWQAVLEE